VQVYSYTLKLNETANPQGVAAGLQVASEDKIELDIAGQGGLPEDILVTQSVMTGLGMLMFVISALAVLSTSWMDIQDRQREIGILKAVGMTPGQLAVSVLAGAAAMSLMGYAIGLPLGIFGVRALIDIVARMTGFGPLHAPLDVLGLVLILPLVSCAALLGASIPARRAAGLSVVELLRYE
jgi:putative ABC transport system permease protein